MISIDILASLSIMLITDDTLGETLYERCPQGCIRVSSNIIYSSSRLIQ